MPAKVYLDAPPDGDFRAMPARGDGFALLKWVTSFPGNPARGLPVVTGALLLSSAETGELLAIMDCAAVTSLRTGAAAAVSAQALAREGAESVGLDRMRGERGLGGAVPRGGGVLVVGFASTPGMRPRRRSPRSWAGQAGSRTRPWRRTWS